MTDECIFIIIMYMHFEALCTTELAINLHHEFLCKQ